VLIGALGSRLARIEVYLRLLAEEEDRLPASSLHLLEFNDSANSER